jgi:hypothetical protein
MLGVRYSKGIVDGLTQFATHWFKGTRSDGVFPSLPPNFDASNETGAVLAAGNEGNHRVLRDFRRFGR